MCLTEWYDWLEEDMLLSHSRSWSPEVGRQVMLVLKWKAQKVQKVTVVLPAQSQVLVARPFQSKVVAA